jgi:hypothetical protein
MNRPRGLNTSTGTIDFDASQKNVSMSFHIYGAFNSGECDVSVRSSGHGQDHPEGPYYNTTVVSLSTKVPLPNCYQTAICGQVIPTVYLQ